jgi:hypothetical protein
MKNMSRDETHAEKLKRTNRRPSNEKDSWRKETEEKVMRATPNY